MQHSLARGYATQFIDQQIDFARVYDWNINGRSKSALRAFDKFRFAKKPGRVAQRVSKYTRPEFGQLMCSSWSRNCKVLTATGLSSARETSVFSVGNSNEHLYNEKTVIVSNMRLESDGYKLTGYAYPQVSISHHTLTRLFERGVASYEDINSHVEAISAFSRALGIFLTEHNIPSENSFLIPYNDGALPIVIMDLIPDPQRNKYKDRVLSVRTFLASNMLTEDHHRRMENYEHFIRNFYKAEELDACMGFLNRNKRAFELSAKS